MITKEAFFGRSRHLVTGVDATIFPQLHRVMAVNATSAGVDLTLPDARRLEPGAPICTIINIGGNAFDVRDNVGGLVATVPTTDAAKLYLADVSTQAGTWYARVRAKR